MRNSDQIFPFPLADIKSIDQLRKLFIEEWNWENPRFDNYQFSYPEGIVDYIKKTICIAEKFDSKVLLFHLRNLEQPTRQLKSIERRILLSPEIKRLVENNIFIFSYNNFDYLDFINAERVGTNIKIKRFSITPENRNKLRTLTEQLNKLHLTTDVSDAYWVRRRIEEAFSVEAVTEKFYEGYLAIFNKIKEALSKQKVDVEEKEKKLRDFVHQTLNRIMFLYFVQKRESFGNDKNFLANFWDKYKSKFIDTEQFHSKWLNVLFFESLCRPSWLYRDKDYLGDFNQSLKDAPYLNGGLFEKSELDEIGWLIPDELFHKIFDFFESYNFTVEESTPFDIDIAINPEMLGNVYEHLVNVEEQEEQRRAGIFYTPKVEIELMTRRSLVEFLYNKLKIDKKKLYQFIFREIEQEIECPFTNLEAEKVLKELDDILILDPACGSGHYLVVTAQILYELKQVLWQCLKKEHLDKYEEKKKIIERNIYGNDIKEWAVEVAKLRLWLELFVDAEIDRLKNQHDPLLPNLNFKIRCGDSLVQRIGNKLIPLRKISTIIEIQKDKLKHLINKKIFVYEKGTAKDYKDTLILEQQLLLDAITEYYNKKRFELVRESKQIQGKLEEGYEEISKDKETQLSALQKEINDISEIRNELKELKQPPMIWDLAFAEVFAMKNGFDIVIANPPYVRQEKIEDLLGYYSKSEYKEKLIEQTKSDWAIDYEGKQIKSPIPERFDKKCDLYVYFYLKGLKLLNENGVMCYISSNSWLDVSYGKILQQVLLKSVPIIAIYDNQVKRSFAHADVNTIIAILKAPILKDTDKVIKDNDVRFVMFKKPFEEILYSDKLMELENNNNLKTYPEGKRRETEDYRLHIVNQKDLYEYGKDKHNVYQGNKWGGKYLRAPEIYWKIMEKGKDKLVRLGDIAEVRRGFTTGANEFFYVEDMIDKIKDISQIIHSIKNIGNYKSLAEIKRDKLRIVRNTKTKDYWLIEEEFLKPVIKSPRECKSILIKPEDLKFKVFMCHKSKHELKGKKALDYIEWGENAEIEIKRGSNTGEKIKGCHNLETIKNRNRWYDLGKWEISKNILPMFEDERKSCFYNLSAMIDAALYWVYTNENEILLNVFLNSTIFGLFLELLSRPPEGLGALQMKVYDYENIPVLSISHLKNTFKKLTSIFKEISSREINSILIELRLNPNKPIREQEPNPLPDRKALDDIVFDVLGLTEDERKEVYWAVAELVKNRLEKAKSV